MLRSKISSWRAVLEPHTCPHTKAGWEAAPTAACQSLFGSVKLSRDQTSRMHQKPRGCSAHAKCPSQRVVMANFVWSPEKRQWLNNPSVNAGGIISGMQPGRGHTGTGSVSHPLSHSVGFSDPWGQASVFMASSEGAE